MSRVQQTGGIEATRSWFLLSLIGAGVFALSGWTRVSPPGLLDHREKEHAKEEDVVTPFCGSMCAKSRRLDALKQMRATEESERLKEEVAQLRSTLAAEREQASRNIKNMEEKQHAAALALKRAEAKVREVETEHVEREREMHSEHEESGRRHQTEMAALKVQHEGAVKEAEAQRQSWRERELALKRAVETATSRADSLTDDLAQCQATKDELDRRLAEVRRELKQREVTAKAEQKQHETELRQQEATIKSEHQKRESAMQAEVASRDAETIRLRERIQQLEHQCSEQAAAADVAHNAKLHQDRVVDCLQTEVAALMSRLDSERLQWSKQADEAQASALGAEEQRRSAANQRLTEEHKRQQAKLQASAKKALAKAAQKRHELKRKIQELVKRVAQLQQEKAAAVRVCEENRSNYELRLAELGIAVGGSAPCHAPPAAYRSGSAQTGSSPHRRELRAILERLEQNTAQRGLLGGASAPGAEAEDV
eukprot:gnl/TRDRNA2_/TRDRNA2_169786_c0_seq3.p1 gnl/TRDRNA2_/TRDRNA2_169786_c0~~gnl/TRDRNA2_/TRDRNA2_169786_c0_seq3.p1  ORF type:complete len:484 (-),score=119.94 gnl/TRDRNA2_/TRDRNA2_169786_c0_seq3:118-1569(-)